MNKSEQVQSESGDVKAYILGLILLGCLLLLLYAGYAFITRIPSDYRPGIRIGEDFLSRSVFAEDPRIDFVTDIRFGDLDTHAGPEYCIAGDLGAIFLEPDGRSFKFVQLRTERYPIHEYWIVSGGNGDCSFMTNGFPPDRERKYELMGIPRNILKTYPLREIAQVSSPVSGPVSGAGRSSGSSDGRSAGNPGPSRADEGCLACRAAARRPPRAR